MTTHIYRGHIITTAKRGHYTFNGANTELRGKSLKQAKQIINYILDEMAGA